jgi:SAM-dependent methyltransferase
VSRQVDWEDCYRSGETPWDKGEPAPGLVDFLEHQVPFLQQDILVPGCGLGHDAKALAGRGYQVTGLDLAPTAVRRADNGSGKGSVRFEEGDYLRLRNRRGFGGLFEHTLFCAIPLESRSDYVNSTAALVRPEGHFLAIHYLNPRDPAGPPFGVSREEILERFTPHFELLAEWVPRSFAGRENRERMLWWRRRKRATGL